MWWHHPRLPDVAVQVVCDIGKNRKVKVPVELYYEIVRAWQEDYDAGLASPFNYLLREVDIKWLRDAPALSKL